MSEVTRVVYDLLDLAERENIEGMFLLLDFEKEFDRVDWRHSSFIILGKV